MDEDLDERAEGSSTDCIVNRKLFLLVCVPAVLHSPAFRVPRAP